MVRHIGFTPKVAKPPTTHTQAVKTAGLVFGTAPALLACSMLAGCAVYDLPDLPPEQIALIAPPSKKWGHGLHIVKIDGRPPAATSSLILVNTAKPVVLAPGKHVIRVRGQLGLTEAIAELWLVAEAGKTYSLERRTDGYTFRIWFVDDETSAPVGGVVGSDDEPH